MKKNRSSNQLYLRVGGTEIRASSVNQAKRLAEISQDIPVRAKVKSGNRSIDIYTRPSGGKTALWVFCIGTGVSVGFWLFKNREKIEKFFKEARNPVIEPTHTEDAEYVDVVQQEQTVGEQPPKTWSEKFLDEFGPMPELPPILQFVVERSPAGYEVAMVGTLLCAFAALCFSKVRSKYLDGKVHAPNLQVLVEGNWGTGKEKFMTALNALFKRLFERDKQKFLSSSNEGKIIQCAGISATESKFIDIMANNGEVHILMVSSEVLAAVNNMRKQNGLTAEYYRKAFDNGEVYRGNKSKDTQGLFKVFMNYILTGTPGDTEKFISKELEGGTASRICWLAIPDSDRYLEALVFEDGEELERYRDQIEEWNRFFCYDHDDSRGWDIPAQEHIIDLACVNDAIKTWIDNQWLRANGDPSDPRIGARGRMGAIAFHFAMVIHMLFGCPGPDMAQSRRKVVDLTIYLANYCMERFLHKFGNIQKVQRELNNMAETVNTPTVNQGTQPSSPKSDEELFYGTLSKDIVKKMVEYYDLSDEIGYMTVVKKFGLPLGEASKKMVSRAIRKWKREQQGK